MLSICYNSWIMHYALNHEQIKSDPERISNIIDRYDWKEINFPSNEKDWNEFEKYINK